jgi:hypothetical protein
MEAVFRPESVWIFFGDFRLGFRSFWQKTPVSHRKKSEAFLGRILLPCSIDFQSFSAGFGDSPTSFGPISMKSSCFLSPNSSPWVAIDII